MTVTSRMMKDADGKYLDPPQYEVLIDGRQVAICQFPHDAITIQEALNAYFAAETATPFEPGDRPYDPKYGANINRMFAEAGGKY